MGRRCKSFTSLLRKPLPSYQPRNAEWALGEQSRPGLDCSVPQSCPTLFNSMDCGSPGFSVLHHLLEFAQTQGPLSQRCHPTISSSVAPFSSCPQSFPESESFPMSWLFTSGGQSIEVLASVLPTNIQGWFFFRIDWFDLFAVQGTLKSLLQHNSSKASILWCSAFFIVQLAHPYIHPYWKNQSFD